MHQSEHHQQQRDVMLQSAKPRCIYILVHVLLLIVSIQVNLSILNIIIITQKTIISTLDILGGLFCIMKSVINLRRIYKN